MRVCVSMYVRLCMFVSVFVCECVFERERVCANEVESLQVLHADSHSPMTSLISTALQQIATGTEYKNLNSKTDFFDRSTPLGFSSVGSVDPWPVLLLYQYVHRETMRLSGHEQLLFGRST